MKFTEIRRARRTRLLKLLERYETKRFRLISRPIMLLLLENTNNKCTLWKAAWMLFFTLRERF